MLSKARNGDPSSSEVKAFVPPMQAPQAFVVVGGGEKWSMDLDRAGLRLWIGAFRRQARLSRLGKARAAVSQGDVLFVQSGVGHQK